MTDIEVPDFNGRILRSVAYAYQSRAGAGSAIFATRKFRCAGSYTIVDVSLVHNEPG